MKRVVSIIVLAFAFIGSINAVIVQKLYLKNGSVLSGYIQKIDGKGNITFHSDIAEICIKGKDASVSNERNYMVSDLSSSWVKWAEEHDAFIGTGNNRVLFLSDVTYKNRTAVRVRILERGEYLKYLEITPNTHTIAWKDVVTIKGDKRDKTELSGINRIYQLKSGIEYEGEYAEENDSVLTLYLENGVRQSLKTNDVVKYTFKPINPDQDIFEQSKLLNIVKSKNGNEIKGIIIEQNYTSKNDAENYFLIKQESGAIQSVKLSDIAETRKEENPKYNPKYDIMLKDGELVVNRLPMIQTTIKENGDEIVLDSLCEKNKIAKEGISPYKIVVEFRDDVNKVGSYQLVKIIKKKAKKDEYYYFSYRDLVNSSYRPISNETSVNHTTRLEFRVDKGGLYILYDSISKKAIPFTIE